jgi:hypothetical protein
LLKQPKTRRALGLGLVERILKRVAESAPAAATPSPKPRIAPSERAFHLSDLIDTLHEEPVEDANVGYVLPYATSVKMCEPTSISYSGAGVGPAPSGPRAYTLTVQGSGPSDSISLLLHPSELLPRHPPLQPAMMPSAGLGAARDESSASAKRQRLSAKGSKEHAPGEPLVEFDHDLNLLREFFPDPTNGSAVPTLDEMIKYLSDPAKSFAFCLVIQQRSFDRRIVDPMTGLLLSDDQIASLQAQSGQSIESILEYYKSSRKAIARIEAIYDLSKENRIAPILDEMEE